MSVLLRWALTAQGLLYVVTGLWGAVHRRSFEAVTGPKVDYWLVRMVGLLAAVIGATLLCAVAQPESGLSGAAIAFLAVGSAAAFTIIDVVYATRRRISRIYLADAVLECVLLCCVLVGLSQAGVAHTRSAPMNPQAATRPAEPEANADANANATAKAASTADADSAVATLRAYYAAIDARDFARAFAAWGSSGPPGDPSLSKFAAGYAGTDSVRLSAGAPGRIEGAAGSRYVDIPVTVHAFEHGTAVLYTGTYTLRRTVVTGAAPSDARWHLYRADLVRSQ